MTAKSSTTTVTLVQAKANFSKLVHQASTGQIITITHDGRALARLVPIQQPPRQRIGAMKGMLTIPDDFDAPLPADLLDAFEQ
ncbi:type II toxin-antitoxin system prevent-host-death family antitoxin [Pseudomonas sp. 18.1.10]|uniref:type II toxin-antitoxin system Phd/YefM family antitoxin n=1 Tax=Pseudomonas sp. 18.1.10 TaxID=2969302 RepID=UPI00214FDC69|nr:type II toxin-antitoxin system prevent-host-death family antitoxin [Pseudomonas sp. 18.1.10]MCR4541349.1 type II toxin-antitoxin system prevent-host-death family antitoxin [Pseudomonas sp. 18.1.10]